MENQETGSKAQITVIDSLGGFKTINLLLALERFSTFQICFIGFLNMLAIGLLDYLTGIEVSLSVFYLIPVAIVGWGAGIIPATITSFLSAAIWGYSNHLGGEVFSTDWIQVWNTVTRFGLFMIVSLLLAQLRHMIRREAKLARTDSLTKLLNYRAIKEIARLELARAKRTGANISIAYVDLDDFKKINDTLGHAGGDKVLKAVGQSLKGGLRPYDYVARIGGDEFLLLLPETNTEQATACLKRILERLDSDAELSEAQVTFSAGALSGPVGTLSFEEWITRVDALMYRVKKNGKAGLLFEDITATNSKKLSA
ncbi:MAG: diguanylate cyclase [Proteobacteria bacterium]|nr:diguanylate cyclase [Pseudomonadota bacterium]